LDDGAFTVIFVVRVARPCRARARATATLLALAAVAGCHSADKLFCEKSGCVWTSAEWSRVQTLSPLPAPPPDPSNVYWSRQDAAELGQAFYFDTRFSGKSTGQDSIKRNVGVSRTATGTPVNVACASCHDPRYAGSDVTSMPNTVSIGAGVYDVNGQQTVNALFYPLLYWNGRSDSLWSQAIAVNTSPFSMNSTPLHDFWVIVDNYAAAYNAVFTDAPLPADTSNFPPDGSPVTETPQQTVVNRVFVNFGKAIAAYEYRLYTRGSAFDRFVKAGPGSGWITAQAEQGARLFVGKASCIDCHNSPLLSDGRFHNIAVPQSGAHVPTLGDCPSSNANCKCTPGDEAASCEPSGAWSGALKLEGNAKAGFNRFEPDRAPETTWSDAPDSPEPCATTAIGGGVDCAGQPNAQLKGAWRTPSLRDVAITPPYMHDGYYQTLTQVVQHYNHGGVPGAGTTFQLPTCGTLDAGGAACNDAGAPQSRVAVQIKPLDLTDDEVAALVAFLQTLTSDPLPGELTSMGTKDAGPVTDARFDGHPMDAHGSPNDAHLATDGHPATDAHSTADAHPATDGSPGQ
jgi:cytochrome c peroxidase